MIARSYAKLTVKKIASALGLLFCGMGLAVTLVFTKRFDLFIPFVILTLAVTVVLVRLVYPRWAKWMIGVFSLIAFWTIGHIDEFLGKREHRELCERHARVMIYGTVRLPADFYDVNKEPKFLDSKFNPNEKLLDPYIHFVSKKSNVSNRYVTIDQFNYQILDAPTGKILGEIVDYNRAASPFIPTLAQIGGNQGWCDSNGVDAQIKQYRELFQRVLIR